MRHITLSVFIKYHRMTEDGNIKTGCNHSDITSVLSDAKVVKFQVCLKLDNIGIADERRSFDLSTPQIS